MQIPSPSSSLAIPSERNEGLVVLRVLKLAQAPAVVAQSHGTELLYTMR